MSEPSEADIAKVKAALEEDIAWAVRVGPGWNPVRIARIENGSFTADACGVCAIAAHVVRHGVPAVLVPGGGDECLQRFDCNVKAAAFSLGVDKDWLDEVCNFVGFEDEDYDEEREEVDGSQVAYWSAWDLSRDLRQFGRTEAAAFEAEKDKP